MQNKKSNINLLNTQNVCRFSIATTTTITTTL